MHRKILYTTILSLLTFLFATCSFAQEQTSSTNSPQNITEQIDLKKYFDDLNGTIIFYNPENEKYIVYNEQLSEKPSSPCSTFKIFSTYVGLLTNHIDPENSLRRWNGTKYWMNEWNRDIDLDNAFKYSCVWYYRRVIDDIGQETMQQYLNEYNYGNKDISDWKGDLNTNEPSYDLKGFWIESSLKISPKEQTQVISKIFADLQKANNQAVINEMKHVMLAYENTDQNLKIYGKTGYGVVNDEPADAWFVGMYEVNGKTNYFALRLDNPKNAKSTSAKAKEIAINIIKDNADKLF
ncbi:class D beta-lactamase [Megamonas hypermegale]|uniref:class D beta-lactamase n=1 Tax=Megamonas hypermegale TaxID=158847 RepID=UPI00195BCA84|nr:class D beta-lactamase [Megamonas hypermegale]MBM6833149.1 class D beta-lactamase [Megamonas hypermegale]